MQTSEIFKIEITVTKEHIDTQNHVNNLVYMQWCLDVAEAHWNEKTTVDQREKYIWYVLNHNIDYTASAYLGDTLEIQTWIANVEGVKSERQYKIIRHKDQKILVEAKTLWCLLDPKTLRPTVVNDEIINLFK